MRKRNHLKTLAIAALCGVWTLASATRPGPAPVKVSIAAKPIAAALNEFARQTGLHVVIDSRTARGVMSRAIDGTFTTENALKQLLADTGLRFEYVDETTVAIRDGRVERSTDASAAEQMRLAAGPGNEVRPSPAADQQRDSQQVTVEATRERSRPVAGGNLDLPRSEDDPLPYQVFTHDDLARKGAIDLADFLRQEVVDLDVSTILPGENQVGGTGDYWATGTGMNLRGFGNDQTVVLVNGRRLPPAQYGTATGSPNLNAVPVSMIERIEVLPASASAIYGGSALGGVINIILRPAADFTSVTSTYNNATGGFDAPQVSFGLAHGQSLLGGKLDLSFSVNHTRIVPASESELGYMRAENERTLATNPPSPTSSLYGATPNIRSANGSGLFGPGSSSVTSVAPGADGLGGLAAFTGREGVRNTDLFRLPDGGRNLSSRSLDMQYGQNRERASYTGGLRYRPAGWLELAANVSTTTEKNRGGHRIFNRQQTVPANSPFNPFGQAVIVTLHEYAPRLGEGYYMGRNRSYSGALGAQMSFKDDWSLSLDYQRSRSQLKFRSFFWNAARIDALVASGEYNPFRDSLAYGMPDAFYEQVLTFDNGVGGYQLMAPVTVDEYSTRLVNAALPLPTGAGVMVIGANHVRTDIGNVTNVSLYGDGTIRSESSLGPYYARSRYDWGIYGELQLPLLPERWLPRGLRGVQADIAYRYSGSDTFERSPNPPTLALRLDFAGGLSLRAAHTVAFRPPAPGDTIQVGEEQQPGDVTIRDPRRGNEQYTAPYQSGPNPDLLTEEGITRTVGLILQRGTVHRLRASLDYVDTDKTNEITWLSTTMALDNETWYPDRVEREAPQAGDPYGTGRITFIHGGPINVLGRRSKNWNASLQYVWNGVFGGAWELRGRAFGFDSYKTQLLPAAPVVENIENPDASLRFLKYRGTTGTSWSRGGFSVGVDGQYFHSRMLARSSWASQGGQRIDRYWKFDAYVQGDLSQFIPGKALSGLRGQLRIDNAFNANYPFYAAGSGDVALYGDWRGQTYSLSLTATF